jgi:hypothetical protein
MFKLLLVLCVALAFAIPAFAQTETVEKRVEIDSATGERHVYYVTAEGKSEDITPYTDMININPLKFIYAYNISYMHKLSKVTSTGIGVEYGSFYTYPAWGISGEFRFFPGKKAMHGFYLAPNVSYKHSRRESYYYSDGVGGGYYSDHTDQLLTIGMLLGWQWFPYENFPMGLSFGVDDYIPLNQDDRRSESILGLYGSGLAPALRFDLGFAW